MKGGEDGKGIHSRWYPRTLHDRILAIHEKRQKFTFIHGDGFEVIKESLNVTSVAYFIDPPYVKAARRLYTYHSINHEALLDLAEQVAGDVLMTYDNDDTIRCMAANRNFEIRAIAMKNAHHAQQTELLIGKNLSWV